MSDDLLTTIRFEVDASGVSTGLTSVKREISDLGAKTRTITKEVNDQLKTIGDSNLDAGAKKATKALTREMGELAKQLAATGSTVQKEFKNISKSADEVFVNLSGKGVPTAAIDSYIKLQKEAQGVAQKQAETAAKSAAEQAAATQKAIAVEEHYASLKSQHAAYNKTIADATAASLREELALLASINDATLRIKTTGRAAATPSTYYEAKAGAAPSANVNAALNAMKAEEAEIIRLNKLKADSALLEEKQTKATRDRAAALVAYYTEAQNAELNLIHTGRSKSSAMLVDKGQRLGFTDAEVNAAVGNLKKIEAANAAAFAAANPHLGKLKEQAEAAGTSVKGLSANLRQVPAQFTDIIVSLQGGQAPLTVLLQQGGQLKDLFGGTGNAARALGGYVMGLVNPYTILAGTVGALAMAYIQGAAESEAYNKSLIMTGNAVGTTAGQLSQMAQAVSQVTGGTVGAAAESLALLAGSSNIATSQFEKITAVATQMERVAGVAIKDTVAQFAELGKDPVAASEKLNASTHYLTAEIYHQIKALEDQGDKLGAAALAQETYYNAAMQRIPQLAENLGVLEKAWKAVWGAVKGTGDAILEFGRTDSIEEKIRQLQIQRNYIDDGVYGGFGNSAKKKQELDEQLTYYKHILASQQDLARSQKESAAQTEASIALSKEAEKNASKQEVHYKKMVQLGAEFAKLTNPSAQDIANFAKAASNQADSFNGATKAVRAHKDAISEADKGLKLYFDLMDKGAGFTATWAEQVNQLRASLDTGGISQEQFNAAVQELYSKQPLVIAALKEQEKANKALEKSLDELVKSMDDYTEAGRKADADKLKAKNAVAEYVKGINDSAAALEFETGLMGQSAEARATAIEQNAIYAESLKKIADIMKDPAWGADTAARDAAIVDVQVATATKAATASGRAALTEWNKTYDRIESGLTDALMKGGKEGAQGVRDLLVQEIFSRPFQMVVQALVQPVAGAITNAVVGGVTGGASGALSGLGTAANLYSAGKTTLGGLSSGATSIGSILTATGAEVSTALSYGTAIGSTQTAMLAASEAGMGLTSSLGGLGTALSAIPVWGWATAGLALFGGDLFGGGGGPKTESAYGYDSAASTNGVGVYGDTSKTGGAGKYVTSVEKAWDSLATTLGVTEDLIATAGYSIDSLGDDITFFQAAAKLGAVEVSDRIDRMGGVREAGVGRSDEELQAAMENEMTRILFEALQASDLPAQYTDYLNSVEAGFTADTTEADQIDAMRVAMENVVVIHDFQAALENLPFEYLAGLSFNAAKGLIEAAGGLDKLDASLSGYYNNFYSDEEKQKLLTTTTAKAFENLGLVMPAVDESLRAAYRSEIERLGAMDLSIAANAKAYASVLSLQGAVDSLADGAETTAAEVVKLAEKLAETNQGWQDQLDVLAGATTEREIALRNTTEATTRSLMRQVYAQEDLKSATDSTIESYNAIMDSAANIRDTVAGVGTSVSDAIFGMQYGLEDNAGKYSMLDVKGARLEDQMFASKDIYAIAQLAQDQISLINTAWSLLDPEQQKSQLVPYEDKLNTISDFVMQKGADPVALAKAANEATAKAIAEAVKAGIAEAMADPTSKLAQAAADVKAAANTPAQVTSNVNVTVTAPAGSEVSIA